MFHNAFSIEREAYMTAIDSLPSGIHIDRANVFADVYRGKYIDHEHPLTMEYKN